VEADALFDDREALLYTGTPAALPAMSHNAISMALTALPHGLKLPRARIFSITRSTLVGSSPRTKSR
jgi:hypothetical protein